MSALSTAARTAERTMRRDQRRRQRAFTLLEMLTVVALVGILGAIAAPYYGYYIQRGHLTEAVSTLASERGLLEQYYQDNGNYGTGGACGVTMPTVASGAVTYFTYVCVASSSSGGATDDGYTITATGNAAQSMTGFSYTVDQSNNKTSAMTATGWRNPTPNNCWALRKDGSC